MGTTDPEALGQMNTDKNDSNLKTATRGAPASASRARVMDQILLSAACEGLFVPQCDDMGRRAWHDALEHNTRRELPTRGPGDHAKGQRIARLHVEEQARHQASERERSDQAERQPQRREAASFGNTCLKTSPGTHRAPCGYRIPACAASRPRPSPRTRRPPRAPVPALRTQPAERGSAAAGRRKCETSSSMVATL